MWLFGTTFGISVLSFGAMLLGGWGPADQRILGSILYFLLGCSPSRSPPSLYWRPSSWHFSGSFDARCDCIE
jgi:hypothetical protein